MRGSIQRGERLLRCRQIPFCKAAIPESTSKISKTWRAVVDSLKHTWDGLKATRSDLVYVFERKFGRRASVAPSFHDRMRMRAASSDLFKFIPFSVFIVVPFAEALIPVYLYLIPNAAPSHFCSSASRDKTTKLLLQKQLAAWEGLDQLLRANGTFDMQKLEVVKKAIQEKDPRAHQLVKELDDEFVKHVRENHELYHKFMSPRNMNYDELRLVMNVFRWSYVSGFGIIERLLNIDVVLTNFFFKIIRRKRMIPLRTYDFNVFPISFFLRKILLSQLLRESRFEKETDRIINEHPDEQFAFATADDLIKLSRNRFFLQTNPHHIIEYYKHLWLPLQDLTGNQKMWIQVMRGNYFEYLLHDPAIKNK